MPNDRQSPHFLAAIAAAGASSAGGLTAAISAAGVSPAGGITAAIAAAGVSPAGGITAAIAAAGVSPAGGITAAIAAAGVSPDWGIAAAIATTAQQRQYPFISCLNSVTEAADGTFYFGRHLTFIEQHRRDILRLSGDTSLGISLSSKANGIVHDYYAPRAETPRITNDLWGPSDCISLLKNVDPKLVRLYIGAYRALHGNNPDRERHCLISLRELWDHLLRRLAPDDRVCAWIPRVSNQQDLLHKDKPTRRAKVLYVCRELNNGPLTEFFMHDAHAIVKLIDLLNRVHKLDTGLTDEQLRGIFLKTDSSLMYILKISSRDYHK